MKFFPEDMEGHPRRSGVTLMSPLSDSGSERVKRDSNPRPCDTGGTSYNHLSYQATNNCQTVANDQASSSLTVQA